MRGGTQRGHWPGPAAAGLILTAWRQPGWKLGMIRWGRDGRFAAGAIWFFMVLMLSCFSFLNLSLHYVMA